MRGWLTVPREIIANLRAERWRAVAVTIVAAAATAVVVAAEAQAIGTALETELEMQAAGRFVFQAQNAEPDAYLSAQQCVALRSQPGVIASGGMSDGEPVRIRKAPGEFLTLRPMVGDMVTLLAGHSLSVSSDIAVAEPLADRVGLATGMTVELDGYGAAAVEVLDLSDREPDPGAWVLVQAAPTGGVTECWAEVTPAVAGVAPGLIEARLSAGGAAVHVFPRLSGERFQVAPLEAFESRPTKYLWAAAGATLALVIVAFVWFRRAEIALYRTVGADRPSVVVIYVGQYAISVTLGVVAGVFAGVYVAGLVNSAFLADYVAASFRQGALVLLSALIAITVGVVMTASGGIATQIRERL